MSYVPLADATVKKTTVVLCTFNGAAFLSEQLKTLLAQSLLPDEIVIFDDASSDDTWEIVTCFAGDAASRGVAVVALQNRDRLGFAGNFSKALEAATGDIIFLCDQDDLWHPDKLAVMVAHFLREPDLLFLHSNARLVDSKGVDLGNSLFEALEMSDCERNRILSSDAFAVYLRRNLATGAASAFRGSLLAAALPVPAGWIHDAWLAVIATARGRIAIVDDPLIDYRQHGSNQIGMSMRTPLLRVKDLFRSWNDAVRGDVARTEILIDRLTQCGASTAHLEIARDMLEHLEVRLEIGRRPVLRRLLTVIREWSTGRYTRFGTGIRSALRDLLRIG